MTLTLGASANHPATSLNQSFQDLMTGGPSNPFGGNGTGPLRSRRTFTSGPPPSSWANTPASSDVPLHGVALSWWSCKPNLTTLLAGGYNANLDGLIATFPANHSGIWTMQHEPENNGFPASQYRAAQKYFHTYITENRGAKDIRTAPVITSQTSDPSGNFDLIDWVPVYQSGDDLPTGYSIGDPAFDLWAWDFYDFNTGGIYGRAWGPVAGGNQLGLTGYIDGLVDIINGYPGGSGFTRADLSWGLGEVGTLKTGAASATWWADLVTNAAADTSDAVTFCYWDSAAAHVWYMQPQMQAWITANGTVFGNGTPAVVEDTLTFVYDVAGASVIEDTLTFPYAVDGDDPVATGAFVGWGIPV